MTHYAQKSWLALAFQKTRNSRLPGRAPQWVSKLKKDNYCLARAFHKSIKDQEVRFPVHHCFPQSLWYSNRIVRDGRGWITALGNCRQSSAARSDNRTAGGRNRVTRTSATAPPPVQIPHADAINHITYQLHNADEVPPVRGDKPGITAQGDGWILLVYEKNLCRQHASPRKRALPSFLSWHCPVLKWNLQCWERTFYRADGRIQGQPWAIGLYVLCFKRCHMIWKNNTSKLSFCH